MDLQTYFQVKCTVKALLDINLDDYKEEQMRRRLDSWLARSGAKTWPAYFRRVRVEPNELARLRNYLTINVSAFFRDAERWRELGEWVIPELLKARPRLRLWSAGCSIGLEPYSLAMLLDEITPFRRHLILATDLDRGALEKARAGGPYGPQEVQDLSEIQLNRFFKPGGPPHYVDQSLRRRIQFREHDLLQGDFEGDFDLILCRNVVIYFTNAAKERLYRKFCAALRPGGVLFIGSTEIISHAPELGLRTHGISFYRRSIAEPSAVGSTRRTACCR